ncbi:hypothetical protein [Hymenobacter ruricola]|uniref:Uncharacterized protein n=1 Tax=Hymenobacter ruricola TaxID=2791023 RepID=A0ABS0I0P3_9BACT|nr:hypothetical protein [Hymenobacter ruricola]MBF9220303.1 hypothetical protein [Hymenobacter ruricola]
MKPAVHALGKLAVRVPNLESALPARVAAYRLACQILGIEGPASSMKATLRWSE